jgi:hypothetical protein
VIKSNQIDDFIRQIANILQANLKENSIFLIDNVVDEKTKREKLAQLFFEDIEVPIRIY